MRGSFYSLSAAAIIIVIIITILYVGLCCYYHEEDVAFDLMHALGHKQCHQEILYCRYYYYYAHTRPHIIFHT